MRNTMTFLVSMTMLLTLSACSPTKSTNREKATADLNKSIEEAKKNAAEIAESLEKATHEAADTTAKAKETAMDSLASGGQPGTIFISGALAVDESTLESRVSVNLKSGKSWRGQSPEITSETLKLQPKISASSREEVEAFKDDLSFVNLGCDASNFKETKDLKEKAIEISAESTTAKSKVILVCDGKKLTGNLNILTAEIVILSNMTYQLIGTIGENLTINANTLIIDGENRVTSKGIDGTSTILRGPSISIIADRVLGTGELIVNSEGSSYQEQKK